MNKIIEQIKDALVSLGAFDDESEKALREIGESTESLDGHPVEAEIHGKMSCALEELRAVDEGEAEEGNLPSRGLTALEQHLAEAVTEHPAIALSIGRLANALAVSGL